MATNGKKLKELRATVQRHVHTLLENVQNDDVMRRLLEVPDATELVQLVNCGSLPPHHVGNDVDNSEAWTTDTHPWLVEQHSPLLVQRLRVLKAAWMAVGGPKSQDRAIASA